MLILAAGGALGTTGIQVAKPAGAKVIAADGADWKLERAREIGADPVVNYHASSLSAEVRRLTDGQGVDVVFENLPTPELWPESLASAGMLGRVVTWGALGGATVETNMRAFYVRHLSPIGARGAPMDQIQGVYRLAAVGRLKAVIDRRLFLAEAAAAPALG